MDQAEIPSVFEALKGITAYGAYQYFEEDAKGTLACGKTAYFTRLQQNPLTVDRNDIKEIRTNAKSVE